ncbi:histidine phosphatase family protein [Myxococcota bacterium]|nr:histidine phosphatase family protein [Myxococcota bacterium]MBU1411178.1 histidine phosphatase family protein [Myxococcota bacterium]MBU1510986.1 histidine phosphatase family protein [Myxococcota bacterium]
MREFYFIRHANTEWNLQKRMQGSLDSDLTPEGREATRRLAVSLRAMAFDVCYSSPMGRARATADLLFVGRGVPVVHLEELAEMGFGGMEGLQLEEFRRRFPVEFHNLWHDATAYDPSSFHGESFAAAGARARKALALILDQGHKRIAVVSHGIMLKLVFGALRGRGLESFWENPVPENGVVTRVLMDEGGRATDFSIL